MRATQHYQIKFGEISSGTLYSRLPEDTRAFVCKQAFLHRFTQQELRQVCEIALDLAMWQQDGIDRAWPQDDSHAADRGAKKSCSTSCSSTGKASRRRQIDIRPGRRQPARGPMLSRCCAAKTDSAWAHAR